MLDGTTGQPCGPIWLIGGVPLTAPSSWISLTPVKPTPLICAVVPWSTGVWSSTSIRTHTNSGRLGSSEILLDLADRHAGEGHVRALVEPADRLAEIDVEAFGLLVREAGKPDDEQQHAASNAAVTAPTIT